MKQVDKYKVIWTYKENLPQGWDCQEFWFNSFAMAQEIARAIDSNNADTISIAIIEYPSTQHRHVWR